MEANQRMKEIENIVESNMKAGLSANEVSEILVAKYGYSEMDAKYIVLGVAYIKSVES